MKCFNAPHAKRSFVRMVSALIVLGCAEKRVWNAKRDMRKFLQAVTTVNTVDSAACAANAADRVSASMRRDGRLARSVREGIFALIGSNGQNVVIVEQFASVHMDGTEACVLHVEAL